MRLELSSLTIIFFSPPPRLISGLAGQSKQDTQSPPNQRGRRIRKSREPGEPVQKHRHFCLTDIGNWRAGSILPQIPHEAWRIKNRQRKRQLYFDTRTDQTSKNCHAALKALLIDIFAVFTM